MVRYIKVPLSVDGRGGEERGEREGEGREGGLISGSLPYPVNGLGFAVNNDSRELREKTHHSFVVLEMGF